MTSRLADWQVQVKMRTSPSQRFRPRKKLTLIHGALLASFVLHLSMVTLFRVVIYFPRKDVEYMDFHIVAAQSAPLALPAAGNFPEVGQDLSLGNARSSAVLPDIELPTLEFAELRRLRIGRENASALSRYEELFEKEPEDSWARFTRGLQDVGETLSSLAIGRDSPAERRPADASRITVRPAEGFEGTIAWKDPQTERALLFAPPIRILRERKLADIPLPMEFVLQVNGMGRIVDAFSPTVDPQGIVDEVQFAVLQYRFEPLPPGVPAGRPESATLVLRAVEADP